MTSRIAVLGLGLIGGSIALGLARAGYSVAGFDIDEEASAGARRMGIAVAPDPAAALIGADAIVLAMPVDQIPVALEQAAAAAEDAVITDVGSAKVEVVTRGRELFGDRFVGGHPMAGSERHGIEAADGELFRGAWWILTPTEGTSSRAYREVTDLVVALGAKTVALDAGVHDALVARLSHVPQLTASALVEVAAATGDRAALLGLAGNGFRDVTRIAASSPGMWVSILRSNRESVLEALSRLRHRLGDLEEMIGEDRWDELGGFLERARDARLRLFAKPHYVGEPVALAMMIPDRPGILASVTTAAGVLGANIEDLRIVHSTEGGAGRLELVISGEEAATRLADRLVELGYHVDRGWGA